MPRSLRLPSGPQRLALAEGHDGALLHPDFAPEAHRADIEPGLLRRLASGSVQAFEQLGAILSADPQAVEPDGWAPDIPEWATAGERTTHGYTLIENIALIEVEGMLMARGFTGWWSGCYWPGYRDYVAAIEAANEDDRVAGILIRFDTPGGYVTGCAEAARAIRSMRAQNGGKPIVGHASELCASAGMKLAAQCDAFYASDGAIIGSVGVRIGFFDFEGALERWGERHHLYKSGRLKDMGSPLRAPTDEEAGIYQAEVDHLADRFFVELAAGRGLDLEAVRESRGFEARTFTAGDPPPPVELDPMADGVDLIDGVLTEEAAFGVAQALASASAAAPSSLSAPSAVASRAAGTRDPNAADSKMETDMSLQAKVAALQARAEGGDQAAIAELAALRQQLGVTAETDVQPEAEGGEDDADADGGEGDESEAEDGDDAPESESDGDDDADAEDEGEDDAEAKAAKVLAHAAAQKRPNLAGKLAVKVAAGKETVEGAIELLAAAGEERSGFRKVAAAMTPPGVKSGEPGKPGDQAQAALSSSMKRFATR